MLAELFKKPIKPMFDGWSESKKIDWLATYHYKLKKRLEPYRRIQRARRLR